MNKKKKWLLVDVETCINSRVYDFSAVIVEFNKGFSNYKILHNISVIVEENSKTELFHDVNNAQNFFAKRNLSKRHEFYNEQLENGNMKIASVYAVNSWLERAYAAYGDDITLTAYNIAFDKKACSQSGIYGLNNFKSTCLWMLSCKFICSRKGYLKFVLRNKFLTAKNNVITNAETVYKYVSNDLKYNEPHTGYLDLISCEIPILQAILRLKKSLKSDASMVYAWRKWELPIVLERLDFNIA